MTVLGASDLLEIVTVAAYGLLFGSFLNVVIHRVPRRLSIIRPRSHCPRCAAPVRWFHNLPVVSWVALGGRCAECREPIAFRYPMVELVASAITVANYLRFGPTVVFVIVATFCLTMIALFMIDLELQLLPFAITKPAVVVGLLVVPWNPRVHDDCLRLLLGQAGIASASESLSTAWGMAVAGAVLGYGLPRLLMFTWKRLRGVEGMGGGDPVMLAMIGAFVGPCGVIAVLLLGSLAGVVVGFALIALRRADMQTALPYGCFLAPAAVAIMVFGADSVWEAWNAFVLSTVLGVPELP